ncbi:MAG TPA: hypothetical protein VFV38_07425 [Ktedonobacteraceae bacterium]|nr:hypothetical protein [Ktedonobacteraceae bacterium]
MQEQLSGSVTLRAVAVSCPGYAFRATGLDLCLADLCIGELLFAIVSLFESAGHAIFLYGGVRALLAVLLAHVWHFLCVADRSPQYVAGRRHGSTRLSFWLRVVCVACTYYGRFTAGYPGSLFHFALSMLV